MLSYLLTKIPFSGRFYKKTTNKSTGLNWYFKKTMFTKIAVTDLVFDTMNPAERPRRI